MTNKDAYGEEILAYFNGCTDAVEIIERDDGFIDLSSGPKSYFNKYKDWKPYEKTAISKVEGRVLDVGCGAGRVSLNLQNEGFDVLGIDNSSGAIKVCKGRGVKKAECLNFDEIYKFENNSFDTVVMFGNNFGLFGDFEKARRQLKRLYDLTSDYGIIIAESLDPYKTDLKEHLDYQKENKKRKRMGGQLRIRIRFRKHIGEWFDYLIVSQDEMEKIVRGTGWKIDEFINSQGPSYIAVLVKDNI